MQSHVFWSPDPVARAISCVQLPNINSLNISPSAPSTTRNLLDAWINSILYGTEDIRIAIAT